jgi:hypothetical protein
MIDIISNSRMVAGRAMRLATAAARTPNGRNAFLMGGANLGVQWARSRYEDRPFGMYGAAKSFALGAGMGYYGGIGLRVGARRGFGRGFGGALAGEFAGMGTRMGNYHARAIRSLMGGVRSGSQMRMNF